MLATVGGYAANQILEYLDLDLIAGSPKFLIGYSDITVLQAALWQSIGLTSIAGPALLPQFAEPSGLHPFTAQSFKQAVSCDQPAGVLPSSRSLVSEIQQWDADDDSARKEEPIPGPRTLRPGEAEGWLAPVNIESLLVLAGTPWFPELTGACLVLEAAETTSAPRFHQGLHHLRQLGVFDELAALIIGRFDARSEFPPELLDACLVDVLGSSRMPVVCDLDFGHTDPLLSLPWGVPAVLEASSEFPEVRLTEAAGALGDPEVCAPLNRATQR